MSEDLGRLTRLGFSSLPECLLSVPKEYRDCLDPLGVLPIPDTGVKVYLVLTLVESTLYDRARMPTRRYKDGWYAKLRAVDGRGKSVQIAVFGAFFPWLKLDRGDEIHLYGEVTQFNGVLQINNPELVPPEHRGRIVPIYVGKPGQVSGETLEAAVQRALPQSEAAGSLLLAQSLLRERDFIQVSGMEPQDLLMSLHAPKSLREGEMAASVARRLSLSAILARAAMNQHQAAVPASAIPIDRSLVASMIGRIPYSLTGDQRVAIDEIISDLRSAFPMRRLLSGDVGTGKTITYTIPAVCAHMAGVRVAIMVPSLLLVTQIAREIRTMFPDVPVQEVTHGVKAGDGILVGTNALISAAKKAKLKFGLVVVDEQHKFSVDQKQALQSEGTNLLEATATAIPRTLALVGFGGMPVSILRECPVQKRISTRVVPRAQAEKLYSFLQQLVANGGQAALIYPATDGVDDKDRMSVESAFSRFQAIFGDKVGMVHGKLTDSEKTAVLDRMLDGSLRILVSSTVIEVGVTLPSLKAVVVVHPDRFGLSQLHQLRGRLARKGGDGYFFLLHLKDLDEQAAHRLGLLSKTNDGFELAEHDADVRGYGDVDGGAQVGGTRLLFHGVKLTRQEIEQEAERLGSSRRAA